MGGRGEGAGGDGDRGALDLDLIFNITWSEHGLDGSHKDEPGA